MKQKGYSAVVYLVVELEISQCKYIFCSGLIMPFLSPLHHRQSIMVFQLTLLGWLLAQHHCL